jgi:hypothetical protein
VNTHNCFPTTKTTIFRITAMRNTFDSVVSNEVLYTVTCKYNITFTFISLKRIHFFEFSALACSTSDISQVIFLIKLVYQSIFQDIFCKLDLFIR